MEAVAAFHQTTLADDTVVCDICNEPISEGEEVICHLQSPADQTRYHLNQTRRTEYDDITLTRGVDELVIDGRIGCCSDQSTQQSWPVLLVPRLRLVSPATTATAREIAAHPANREDPADPLEIDFSPSAMIASTNTDPTTDNNGNWQEATLARWQQPTTASQEGGN